MTGPKTQALLSILCLLTLGLAGCAPAAEALAAAPTDAVAAPAVAEPAGPPPRPTHAAPPVHGPSELPMPTASSDVFSGLRIDDLAARSYGGPGIEIEEVVHTGAGFTQYTMTYQSDALTITGLVDIPDGPGPFPTIIVCHGYLRPTEYQSGFDSWRIAEWLAEHGYIALMPDYRNYAGSDTGENPFHIGYAIDLMNLIAQVDSLPQAIPGQIGMIGHSMGGEISMWPMVISDEVDAIVLYSSMSGDVGRNWAHARRYWPAQRAALDALEIIYGRPQDNPEAFAQMSPINYLDRVRMPVMIHHGTQDESVPYEWSEELYHQMQEADLDVTFWPYPGERHTLGGRGFEAMMQRNLEFFETNVRGNVSSPNEAIVPSGAP